MKTLACVLAFASVPALAGAEEAWRWTDSRGGVHYSNQREVAPADAVPVTTRLIMNVTRLPDASGALVMRDGEVVDAAGRAAVEPTTRKRPRQIYTEARRRFGCFAAQTLYAGGWAHADDISVDGGCLPYLLGPEAWFNAARAELALREHGIDWRQLVPMYLAQQRWDAAIEKRILGDD